MQTLGLHYLNRSQRNCTHITERAFSEKYSKNSKHVQNHKKYQPMIPSPLATSSKRADKRENKGSETLPTITLHDLCSEEPTSNYLRALAARLEEELIAEMSKNEELVEQLCRLDEEIQKVEDDTELLLDVLQDIDDEQKAREEGIAHL